MDSITDHLSIAAPLCGAVLLVRLLPALLLTLAVVAIALTSVTFRSPDRRTHARAVITDLTAFAAVMQSPTLRAQGPAPTPA